MLRGFPSILGHKAPLEITLGQRAGTGQSSAVQATTTGSAAAGGTTSSGGDAPDGTRSSDVFETAAQNLSSRYAQRQQGTTSGSVMPSSPSTSHRLQSAINGTQGAVSPVQHAEGTDPSSVDPRVSRSADVLRVPGADQNENLDALFEAVIELTMSDAVPKGRRHRLETGVFDTANRRLTRGVHRSGPQALMTTAAAVRAPQVAGQMLTTDLKGSDVPVQEHAGIIKYQTDFTRQRALDTPEGRVDLKYMMDRRIGEKHGDDAARVMQGQYEVLSCATSFDTDLRPAGSGVSKVRTQEAGDVKTVFRPMTQPESPGTCFGRTSHFINQVSEGLSAGQDIQSCIKNGSTDAASVVPGALKQKIYHHAQDKQKVALDEADQYRRDTIQLVDQRKGLGQIDNDTAARQLDAIEQGFLDTRTSLYGSLFAPLGLQLQSCAVDINDSPDRQNAIDQALSNGGLNAIIGNMHAVAHIKHEDVHYVFDTLCGAYSTGSDDVAKELILLSLNTGHRSPIGSYHFGPTPDAA